MKPITIIQLIILFAGLKGNVFAQDTTKRIITRTFRRGSAPLDTNQIVYDEKGNALRFYQYQHYLNSGEYSIRYSGLPTNPSTKRYLFKLSAQQQNGMYDILKKSGTIKSAFLQEGSSLNINPLLEGLTKAELDNKVIVLIFWDPECPPCTESFADINDFFKQIHNPEDLVILAITNTSKTNAQIKLKDKPLLYAQFMNSARSVYNAYQLNAYPSYVVTDKNHVIRFAHTGSSQITLPAFKSAVKAVLQQ
jgi:peroxiredoxin